MYTTSECILRFKDKSCEDYLWGLNDNVKDTEIIEIILREK